MTGELPKGTYPTIENDLLTRGYEHVYVWHDDKGEHYPPHSHEESVCLVVTKGSMHFEIYGKEMNLHPGDEIEVPKGTIHTSTAGDDGCDFVEGEKA